MRDPKFTYLSYLAAAHGGTYDSTMSYKALLFCPDEKTARVVTQVLSELEFVVEPCNEPFAAVKRLMAEHFDALVVDCENEQNASLLFKSAHNSGGNQASLAVAVVEGQSGVAKAFRIGANLVLTKPINVEQSKGTLRVARGLLKKGETAKASALRPMSEPHEPGIPPMPASLTTPAPGISPSTMVASSSAFELEKEPTPQPEPAEAALLESMPEPAVPVPSKPSSWQPPFAKPMAEPMTAALKQAAEATGKASVETPAATSTPTSGFGSGTAGAAAAPAKIAPPMEEKIDELEEPVATPRFAQMKPSTGPNKGLIAAVAVVAIAAVGYFAFTKLPAGLVTSLIHKGAPAPRAASAPVAPAMPATQNALPAATPNGATPLASTTLTPSTSASVNTTAPAASNPVPPPLQKPTPAPESVVSTPKKPSPAIEPEKETPSVVKTIDEDNPSDAIRVSNQAPKVAAPKPVPVEVEEPSAPGSLDLASNSSNPAIAGLVSTPVRVPTGHAETVNVSQGVSQGLLIKKVPPMYPQQALQMRIQGAVQLMAVISKTGNITNLKVQSGDAVLVKAAMDAVKQWKYKPYLLDDQPVDIQTQITVNFKLP